MYTQSAEMVRSNQLGIGNTFPLALLHRILIRGQLTTKEEIALGSAFDGSVAIATVTVAANGTWSVTVSLSIGTHRLTARQRINTPPHAGLTSNQSNLITITRKG